VAVAVGVTAGAVAEAAEPEAGLEVARYDGFDCPIDPDGFQRSCRPDDGAQVALQELHARMAGQIGRRVREGDPPVVDTPAPFRGWWVEPGKACEPWADDAQLLVGVNLVQFYAGEGSVEAVREVGPGEVELRLNTHTDPADWSTLRLRLSADGSRLFQMDLDNGFERVRCDGRP
jgi:hypothetical protein